MAILRSVPAERSSVVSMAMSSPSPPGWDPKTKVSNSRNALVVAIAAPIEVEGHSITVSARAGMSVDEGSDDADATLRYASEALRRAKRHNVTALIPCDTQQRSAIDLQALIGRELFDALAGNGLRIRHVNRSSICATAARLGSRRCCGGRGRTEGRSRPQTSSLWRRGTALWGRSVSGRSTRRFVSLPR